MVYRKLITVMLISASLLTGCAGRDPQPIAAVQPQDMMHNCTSVQAELAANYQRGISLNQEEANKTTQNVVAGTVGLLLFWPALFAMDLKNAAGQEQASLQGRQAYLTSLQAQRCQNPVPYQYIAGVR